MAPFYGRSAAVALSGAKHQRRAETQNAGRRMMITVALVVLATRWTYREAGAVLWARDIAWSVKD